MVIVVVLFFLAWFVISAILHYIFKVDVSWAVLIGFVVTIIIGALLVG